MSEQPKDDRVDSRSFNLWFYLFAVVTVILVIKDQGLSIESAHSLILMIFVKQIEITWKSSQEEIIRETNDLWLERMVRDLSSRVDRFDPYSDEKE